MWLSSAAHQFPLLPPSRQSPKIWNTITTEENTTAFQGILQIEREKGKTKWGEVKPIGI